MYHEFWRQYSQTFFVLFYFEYQRVFLTRVLRCIAIVTYAVTAASLAGWGITQRYAVIWSLVIFTSQFANSMKEQFELSRRIWCIDQFLEGASRVLERMTEAWLLIMLGQLSDNEIMEKTMSSISSFNDLDEKYIRPFGVREHKRHMKKASAKADNTMVVMHGKDYPDAK